MMLDMGFSEDVFRIAEMLPTERQTVYFRGSSYFKAVSCLADPYQYGFTDSVVDTTCVGVHDDFN